MNLKKGIVSVISAVALMTSVIPSNSSASERNSLPTADVSKEQVNDVKGMLDAIKELERSKMNMDNLSKNKQKDIDKLSKEAQQFYYIFEQVVSENGNDVDKALNTLVMYYQAANKENVISGPQEARASLASIGSVKEYKISNAKIVQMTKDAGLYGGTWAVLIAVAKAFAKSPTVLTAMLVAIPTLGMAVLNKCNKYNKGVIITDVRIGATHNFSCQARR